MSAISDLAAYLTDPWASEFMLRSLLALVMVSVVCAVMGSFVVVKGMAFIGDALAHASFGGVAAAFVLGGNIYLGAAVAAILTSLGIVFVSRRSGLRFDTAIGVLFVGAFALGILIVSRQEGYIVDLFSFVFGNVLGVGQSDLVLIAVVGATVLVLVAVFYKELLFTAYDPAMAAAAGLPVAAMQYGLLALIALTIVISLKAVGIVLVVAMLVTPAATAQLLVQRLHLIMAVGAGIGILSSVVGLYLSYRADVAASAAVVLTATVIFLMTFLLSPRRGILGLRRPSILTKAEEGYGGPR
ncbi:MAG: metal ABC transporter permease [Dehalococcoidia bacterium]|nr:metal ABC transporter permease [Dehalococcoidia bacterium]